MYGSINAGCEGRTYRHEDFARRRRLEELRGRLSFWCRVSGMTPSPFRPTRTRVHTNIFQYTQINTSTQEYRQTLTNEELFRRGLSAVACWCFTDVGAERDGFRYLNGTKKVSKTMEMEPNGKQNEPRNLPKTPMWNRVEKVQKKCAKGEGASIIFRAFLNKNNSS